MGVARLVKLPLYLTFFSLIFSFKNTTAPALAEDSMEQDILRYVNLDRKSKGLKPLQLNDYASSIAEKHSKDMARGKTPFGHDGLNSRAKLLKKKLGSITAVGENVASGKMTAREVVDGWLNSPGHRRNIEGDFTTTGIGLATGRDGTIYFTQIFAK